MEKETCKQCSTVGSCPFSFSEHSDYAQNTGCLPSSYDIVKMRANHGKTWECHSNKGKPCLGALEYLREKKLPFKVIDPKLVTLDDDWDKLLKEPLTEETLTKLRAFTYNEELFNNEKI